MSSPPLPEDTILAWHTHMYRYAQRRGWGAPEAEEIAQHSVVELLEMGVQKCRSLRVAYLRGMDTLLIHCGGRQRVPFVCTSSVGRLTATEDQVCASELLAQLKPYEQQWLRLWMQGHDGGLKSGITPRGMAMRLAQLFTRLREQVEALEM